MINGNKGRKKDGVIDYGTKELWKKWLRLWTDERHRQIRGPDALANKTKSRNAKMREEENDVEELKKNAREAINASNEVSALLRAKRERDDR